MLAEGAWNKELFLGAVLIFPFNSANAFDGDVSTRAQTVGAGTNKTLTWAPSPAVSFSNKFEIYCDQGSNVPTATWNGNTISPGGGQWVTVYTGSGTIDSTTPLVINTNTAQQYATLKAVRLDGRILVDSNVTLSSVPSIASSYRANQSAGFSIVSFTGDDASSGTVAHGLNAKPAFMIIKNRDTSGHDWVVYHQALGATKRLDLNSAGGPSTNIAQFNNTEPTSLVFTVGTYDNINTTDQYIAYVFAPVTGFSAFGSYTGNGSTDGPFIYTGFRPKWILKKRVDATDYWYIWDTSRDPDNVVEAKLEANDSSAEYTSVDWLDILSNGFEIRYNGNDVNNSSGTYLYVAFAENPFQANGGLAR